MHVRRTLVILSTAALGLGALAASVDEHDEAPPEPDTLVVPEACGERTFDDDELADDEVLVERTVYLKSESSVGNVDAAEDTLDSRMGQLFMEEAPPETDEPKLYTVPGFGNDEFTGNPLLVYWQQEVLGEPERRIVCAEATVHTLLSRLANLRGQLWVDAGYGVGVAPVADTSGPGEGTGVRTYTINFSQYVDPEAPDATFRLDTTPQWNIVLQLVPPGGTGTATTVIYDSPSFPSQLTYVTVEQVEELEPAEPEAEPQP